MPATAGKVAGAAQPPHAPPPATIAIAAGASAGALPAPRSAGVRWLAFLLKHYLPLGLVSAILFSAFVPAPGKWLARPEVNGTGVLGQLCIAGIFLLSGLGLKTEDIKHAAREWKGTALGVVLILGVTPLASLIVLQLPLRPREFALGLAVFACVPTTLSSGVVLTRQAGGNFALALMLTVVTNLLGIITVPFMLSAMLGSATNDVSINPVPLLYKLALSILLPLAVGKALRESLKQVPPFVTKHKQKLSLLSSTLLILVPLMRVSVANKQLRMVTASQLFAILAAGVGLHLMYLAIVAPAVALLQVPTAERKAIVLMASAKTLPVAITVISFVAEDLSDGAEEGMADTTGLMAIPCIMAHLSQIVIDSFVAERWARLTEEKDEAEAATAGDGAGEDADAAQPLALSIELGDQADTQGSLGKA